MSDFELGIEGVKLAVAVAAAVLIYAGPFRYARIASWRQDLFALRNGLWDKMRELDALDTEAHRRIRDLINGLIRYAPVMNLFFLATVLWFPGPPKREGYKSLKTLLLEVRRTEVREVLGHTIDTVAGLLFRQLFLHSLPGAIIGWPLIVVLRALDAVSWVRRMHDEGRAVVAGYAEQFGRMAAPVPGAVPSFCRA